MIAIKPASFLRSTLSTERIGDVMLKFAAVAWIVLWSIPAGAIRWEFDDGTTQGWSAKEKIRGAREFNHFPWVVDEGVWRITVDPAATKTVSPLPEGELFSPIIGYDSDLFDYVRIRCRTIHDDPTEGSLGVGWENASGFRASFETLVFKEVVYTTEWQEVVLSLADRDGWEGPLKNIILAFRLSGTARIEKFEIDWIELTGAEELLQGERPPPLVEYFRFDGAGLFAPPVFYPIAPGTGQEFHRGGYIGERQGGVLTDLDGDGDLDLFGLWGTPTKVQQELEPESGWLMALNDGRGALERESVNKVVSIRGSDTEAGTGRVIIPMLSLEAMGADLTGDGQDEIAITITGTDQDLPTEVWSIGPDLQVEVLVQIDRSLHSVADWDGDGRVELFVGGTTYKGTLDDVRNNTAEYFSTLAVWEVEQGRWTSAEVAYSEKYVPQHIGDFTGNGVFEVFWSPIRNLARGWIVSPLDEGLQNSAPEAFQRSEAFEVDEQVGLLGIGDFDGDGQVDFLTEFIRDYIEGSKGIVLQRKGAGDRLEAEVLYDDRLLRRSPVLIRDLNADGVDDWVFVGGDRASGFGVFIEWGGLVNPTQDGERHRLVGNGRIVLSGDMDGDGDEDLVVLDPILGGVHLLKNSLSDKMTAVQTSAVVRPAQYRLGDSYPNPFNPAVVLPLDLAEDAAEVSLRVYDVLGRRVRQVWQGSLRAGQHRFVWDGRDEVGKAVAAGVYVYRVEIDGRVEAKKTTKLP